MTMAEPFCAVVMPKWGIEMQQGTIADWHVSVGQQVAKGDLLVDVETDKIVNTVEAPAAGVLHRVLVGKGDVLPVGALLAVIGAAQARGSDIDRFIADLGMLS
jgi:pyruvate dehydrogenase E2 component (dihydrolipoamide acetyltransferase)